MRTRYITILLCITAFVSCRKNWLDAPPDKSLVVPSEIKDYQALLDNTIQPNMVLSPGYGEISSADYNLETATWQALVNGNEKNLLIWAQDIYEGRGSDDWVAGYSAVLYANIALDGIETVTRTSSNAKDWDNVKGTALFYRAYLFYGLAQVFSAPYKPGLSDGEPGIPLRLTSDVQDKSVRSTLKQTYDQIFSDLKKSLDLLPVTPLYKTRPSRPAVFGMLARVSLAIEDYANALIYSDSALKYTNTLIDYNTVNATAANPMAQFNAEVIFHSQIGNFSSLNPSRHIVNPTLYAMFDANDLRKSIYFGTNAGRTVFKGSYNGNLLLFSGLATDEMYLIRAEAYARVNNIAAAMQDLNALRIKRWKTGTYVPVTATDPNDALTKVLAERRRELSFRGIRWTDLRRLNRDYRFATTLTRVINGQTYSLPPNDIKYVLPIPENEIELSGIQQNPR